LLRKPLHEEITRITPAESRTQNPDAFHAGQSRHRKAQPERRRGQKFDELRAQADALEVEITRLEAVADDQRNLPGTSVEGEV
jgi:hypothetical protein